MNKNISSHNAQLLCTECKLDTKPHFLNNQLVIAFCECKNLGGLHVGFTEKPFWKLYKHMNKDEFFDFAQSAATYVDAMRESHSQLKSA